MRQTSVLWEFIENQSFGTILLLIHNYNEDTCFSIYTKLFSLLKIFKHVWKKRSKSLVTINKSCVMRISCVKLYLSGGKQMKINLRKEVK